MWLLMMMALVLGACGSDTTTAGDSDESAGDVVTTTEAAPTDTEAPESEPEEEPEDEEPSAPGGGGSATLTVGDQIYTFDNYDCASGEGTGNDDVPFSSGAFGEVEGVRVQLDASVYDPSGEGNMEGDGVVNAVTLNDVEDFANPSVSWSAESGFIGGAEFAIQYDGSTVFVESTFDDGRTDEIEQVPGTLEATCGS
jgi:hypothetical protein